MAKFRRLKRRAIGAARRGISYVRKSYAPRRGYAKSGSNPLMNVAVPAFAYGAVRATLKDKLSSVTSFVPLGENADEVVMGIGGYFLMKNTTGFWHDFGRSALTVEAASLGHNIVNPMLQSALGGSSVTASNSVIYQ